MGLSGLTPTLVCVDRAGEAVRPVMTWNDPRGREEAQELEARFGSSEPILGFDLPWSASYPPAKLAWLARHEPAVVAATRSVLQVKDYLGLRLTGSAVSDAWSSKGLCNILTGSPASEVLKECGWDDQVAPEIRPAWEGRGFIGTEAAGYFGLPAGLPVAVGWSDALAGFLALGAFRIPSSVVVIGTSSIIGVSMPDPGPVSHPGLLVVPTPVTPLALLYGPTQSGGSALAWVGRVLGLDPPQVLARSLQAHGTVPVFVPYLSGERTPIWNADVRAAFSNIGEDTGPPEFCAAVVRGVAASARHVLDSITVALGHTIGSAIVVGGYGIEHPAWQDAFALHLDRPIATVEDDVSVLGAAMLGAAASGCPLSDLPRVTHTQQRFRQNDDIDTERQHAYLRLSQLSGDEADARRRLGSRRLPEQGRDIQGGEGDTTPRKGDQR
ncbi:MAG: xylulokinase [Candidatus Dormibacteria bacterium]